MLAAAAFEFGGQGPPLFLERLPRLAECESLDLQIAIDVGPQVGPLGGDLVAQAEHDPFLLLEIADQPLAGADFFVQVALAGLEVGLPLEHVLFELVDPHPRTAPLLIEQGVLFVQRLLPPFELFAFGAEMGGNLRRLPQDFFLAARRARREGESGTPGSGMDVRPVCQFLVVGEGGLGGPRSGPGVGLVDADTRQRRQPARQGGHRLGRFLVDNLAGQAAQERGRAAGRSLRRRPLTIGADRILHTGNPFPVYVRSIASADGEACQGVLPARSDGPPAADGPSPIRQTIRRDC